MPGMPSKTPTSAIRTSEQRVGQLRQSDTDLLTTQLRYAMASLDAAGISDRLYPSINTDTDKLNLVMYELNKPEEALRKQGLVTLVLKWLPVDFLQKPKAASTERVRTS